MWSIEWLHYLIKLDSCWIYLYSRDRMFHWYYHFLILGIKSWQMGCIRWTESSFSVSVGGNNLQHFGRMLFLFNFQFTMDICLFLGSGFECMLRPSWWDLYSRTWAGIQMPSWFQNICLSKSICTGRWKKKSPTLFLKSVHKGSSTKPLPK